MDAKKVKMGREEARKLLQTATRLVALKGKKRVEFDLGATRLSDEDLDRHVLGPTGNLRAPVLRQGKTLYVGFGEEAYAELA